MANDDNQQKQRRTKAKKIYNIVSTAIVLAVFVLLIAVIGVVLYQRKHGGDAKLFGYYMFNVISDSMDPTIKVGDVILAKEIDDVNSLQIDDIITFIAPSGPLSGQNETHRIVDIVYSDDGSVKYFKTKGDNPNVGMDDWQLSPSAVKAKFVRVSPFITGFRKFISKWYGYVVLVVIPIALMGVFMIVGYVRDRLADAKEEEAAKPLTAADLTDEQKRKLLEDYLASTADGEKSTDAATTSQSSSEQSGEENSPSAVSDAQDQTPDDGSDANA